jgi:hypothetical protein
MLLDTKFLPQKLDNRLEALIRRQLEHALVEMWGGADWL